MRGLQSAVESQAQIPDVTPQNAPSMHRTYISTQLTRTSIPSHAWNFLMTLTDYFYHTQPHLLLLPPHPFTLVKLTAGRKTDQKSSTDILLTFDQDRLIDTETQVFLIEVCQGAQVCTV